MDKLTRYGDLIKEALYFVMLWGEEVLVQDEDPHLVLGNDRKQENLVEQWVVLAEVVSLTKRLQSVFLWFGSVVAGTFNLEVNFTLNDEVNSLYFFGSLKYGLSRFKVLLPKEVVHLIQKFILVSFAIEVVHLLEQLNSELFPWVVVL